MGPLRPILAACLALSVSTPAWAQQDNSSAPVFTLPAKPARPATDSTKQGPELDVFRDAAPPVSAPTLTVPTVTAPAVKVPPAPTQAQPAPPQSKPTNPAPSRTTSPTPRPQLRETEPERQGAPTSATVEQPLAEPAAKADIAPASPPRTGSAVVKEKRAPPSVAPAEPHAPVWPWLLAALVAIGVALLAFARPRRRPRVEQVEPAPMGPAVPERAPRPAPSPAKPAPPLPASDRPWIEIALDVRAARLSLIGATIAYRLTLHNRGTAAAEDVLVRTLIANADAEQQALLQRFFAGEAGQPMHSVVSIAPGGDYMLEGEVRIDAANIAPVQMGRRAILVPVIAIDAQYRWADDSGGLNGAGRAARAYIVGQEQDPPTERLAPFRLDLGPRQYRGAAARPTELSLSS